MLILLSFCLLFLLTSQVLANPACPVCVIAIGASLELARYLGVSDNVVGLWAGGLLSLLGYFCILWFDKKNWHFKFRNTILMLISFSMIFAIYIKEMQYFPSMFGFLDPFLFSSLVGFIAFILSQKLYEFMKKKNGGHTHFPFEKVVLPVVILFLLSLIFNNIRL